MAEIFLTIEEQFLWAQDPIQTCAGQPIIPQYNFKPLAEELIKYKEVTYDVDGIIKLFFEVAKKYTACGANFNDKFAVIRKNPKLGWEKVVSRVTEVISTT